MLAMLEGSDLLILAVIVLVLFGGSQLPKLARSLGEAQKELKKAMNDDAPKAESSGESSKATVEGGPSAPSTVAVSAPPAAEVPPSTDAPATDAPATDVVAPAPLNGTAPSEAPKADTP